MISISFFYNRALLGFQNTHKGNHPQLIDYEMSVSEIVNRGHEKSLVKKIENLLYISEYKRRQSAPGVKVSQKNFGRDRRYPITNLFRDKN